MAISNVKLSCTVTSTPAFPGGSITVDAASLLAAEQAVKAVAEARLAAGAAGNAVLEEFISGS